MPNRAAASGREEMHPVHRVQPGGRHADADLTRAGVRLRNLSQLQHLGASERLVDDSSAHGGPPAGKRWDLVPSLYTSDGTKCRTLCPMARWQPNAPERLALAALDLFAERGYENTTVIDIAQRAGLTKSTFFRHFQDKREVLFGGGTMDRTARRGDSRSAGHRHPARSGRSCPGRGRQGSLHARSPRIHRPQAGSDRRQPGTARARSAEGPRPHRVDDRRAQPARRSRPDLVRGRGTGRARLEDRLRALERHGHGDDFGEVARRALDEVQAASALC